MATAESIIPLPDANQELAQQYVQLLKALGYVAEITPGNPIVRFQRDKLILMILPEAKDPQYFRLVVPNLWTLPAGPEREKVLDTIARIAADTKVAKFGLIGEDVFIAIELWAPNLEYITEIFPRIINAATAAAGRFVTDLGIGKK